MTTYYAALGSQYQLQLDVVQASQNIAANQSTVSWALYINKLSGTGRWTSSADSSSVTINGSVYGASFTYDFRSYSSLLIQSGSTVVTHNADGTKSISVSATFNDVQANLGAGTAGGTFALTTIPRASVPTLSPSASFEPLDVITINTNRASTGFSHTLSYSFGSLTAQTSGIANPTLSSASASTTFTPPMALLAQIPNSLSGVGTITVTTFSGATQIGSPQTVNFTLNVPASVVPTISSVTISEETTSPNINTLVGKYVQGLSTLDIDILGANGSQGSTIASYKITVAGQTFNAASAITAPITASGTVQVSAEVTDSRGRKSLFADTPITVLAYTKPTATVVQARRSLTGGTVQQSTGTFIRVDMTAVVQSLINSTQKNLLRYQISTKLHSAPDSSYVVRVGPTSVGASTLVFDSFSGSNPYVQITAGAPYAVTNSYDVKVEILDIFGTVTSSPTVRTVATGITLVDLNGNTGVGFGKYHEFGLVDVAGDIYQNGYKVVDLSAAATGAETITGTSTTKFTTPAGVAAAMQNLTEIPGAVNLNAYTIQGGYHQSANSQAASGTNYPVALAGLLEVSTSGGGFVYQRYTVFSAGGNQVYTRGRYSGTWSAWRYLYVLNGDQPKQGIMASSIVVGSGTATQSVDGTITFTAVSSLSINGIFDGLGADLYNYEMGVLTSVDQQNVFARFRAAGADYSGVGYGAQYVGVVSGATSAGGTNTLNAMYFGYGRSGIGSTAKGIISKPRGITQKTLHTDAHAYGWLVYSMGNFTGMTTSFDSITLYPGGGTMTGTVKFGKL